MAPLNDRSIGRPGGPAADMRFGRVADVFKANFDERGELGAAVSLFVEGRCVVDLWGGTETVDGRPWSKDTIVCIQSVTKGMLALTMHAIVDRGLARWDDRVASHWPEFGAAGKQDMTIDQLISHLGGLIFPDLAPAGSMLDWDCMVTALAAQAPAWPIGTLGAYHSSTYGHLIGELIRRISGRTFPEMFADCFAVPLGLDVHVGLSQQDEQRVARFHESDQSSTLQAISDPSTPLGRAWRVRPNLPDFFNSAEFRRAELGEGNGHSNAYSVARLFAALDNAVDTAGSVLSEKAVTELGLERWKGRCGLTGRQYRMGRGLFLNCVDHPMGPHPGSFGHAGAGGALGFFDPNSRLAFGYTPNRMCAGHSIGDRCGALVEAAYACL